MEKVNSYFDFAENDYKFLKDAYEYNLKGNHMCSMAQEICEKYLKDIISEYIESSINVSEEEFQYEKESVLKSHNLRRLINFIELNSNIQIDNGIKSQLSMINGFYFSTRYPGDDSFFVQKEDIDLSYNAATACRNMILSIKKEKEKNINHNNLDSDNLEEFSL